MEFIIEHRRTHKIIYRSHSFYNAFMKYSNLNPKHYRIIKVLYQKEVNNDNLSICFNRLRYSIYKYI